MKHIAFGHGQAPHRVEAAIVFCGPDISVCFGGGEAQHIGAVALGIPRLSLADASAPSASVSVICVTGHKEDELAREAALELSTAFRCRVNVAAGLHVDAATADDIRLLNENYTAVLCEVKRRISIEVASTPEGGLDE